MRVTLMQAQRGFTIIELLVVFSVISIIAGIGFVSFSSYNDTQKLTGSVKTLESFIDDAKHSAISSVVPERTESGNAINCTQAVSSYSVNICEENANCLASGHDYEIVLRCGINQYIIKTGNFQNGVNFGADSVNECRSISFSILSGVVQLVPNQATCEINLANENNSNSFLVDNAGNIHEQ